MNPATAPSYAELLRELKPILRPALVVMQPVDEPTGPIEPSTRRTDLRVVGERAAG